MDAAAERIAEVVCEACGLIAEIDAGGGRLLDELVAVRAHLRALATRTCDEDAAAAALGAAAELHQVLLLIEIHPAARAA